MKLANFLMFVGCVWLLMYFMGIKPEWRLIAHWTLNIGFFLGLVVMAALSLYRLFFPSK